jgi:hypothetical protein
MTIPPQIAVFAELPHSFISSSSKNYIMLVSILQERKHDFNLQVQEVQAALVWVDLEFLET